MIRLKDFRHELCNEFGKEKIVDIVDDFITKKALPNGPRPQTEGANIESVIELDFAE